MFHPFVRLCSWISILILLSNCRSPAGYINNLPTPSLLERKGDLNLKANMGADFRLNDLIYDFDGAWSPIPNWGIRTHVTAKGNENFYAKLLYMDFGAVYYDSTSSGLDYEIVVGFGRGALEGNEFKSSAGNDHSSLAGILGRNYAYQSRSKSSKIFLQPSFELPHTGDKDLKVTAGLRLQFVDHYEYYYEKKTQWIYDQPFQAVILDPFLTSHYFMGHFGINTTFGYSLNLNQLSAPEYKHPVYK